MCTLCCYSILVCDDHHFKDEGLFFRFKNDDKSKSPKLRDRLNSKKGSKYKDRRGEEDTGSTGDHNEHRESGGSWDSSSASDSHTPHGTPDLDEYVMLFVVVVIHLFIILFK